MKKDAALLYNMTVDDSAVHAKAGDRAVLFADGRVTIMHVLSMKEFFEVLLFEPYTGVALSVNQYFRFVRESRDLQIWAGDYLTYHENPPDGCLASAGDVMITRHLFGYSAHGFAARLLSDQTVALNPNVYVEKGSTGHMIDLLREIHGAVELPNLEILPHSFDRRSSAALTRDTPEIGGRCGDLLVYSSSGELVADPCGSVRWLTVAEYEILAAMPPNLFRVRDKNRKNPISFLGNRGGWGQRLKKWHSRLALVQPWRETISTPIRATSDEAAIFELLAESGYRRIVQDQEAER